MQRRLPWLGTRLPSDSICPSSFLALHALNFQFPINSGLCGQSHLGNVQGSWPLQFTVWAGTLLYSSHPAHPLVLEQPLSHLLSSGEHIPPPAWFHQCSGPQVVHSVAVEHRQLPDVLLQNRLNVY